jgi:hypothetical protein
MERRPVFESAARDFIEYFIEDDRRFLNTYSPEKDEAEFAAKWTSRNTGADEVRRFEPNYEGSPIIAGKSANTPSSRGEHMFKARAGHHLAPLPVQHNRSTYDLLGSDYTLLLSGRAGELAAAFRIEAARMTLPLKIVDDLPQETFAQYQAAAVLVRPDQFVAWAGETGDPAKILAICSGRA